MCLDGFILEMLSVFASRGHLECFMFCWNQQLVDEYPSRAFTGTALVGGGKFIFYPHYNVVI